MRQNTKLRRFPEKLDSGRNRIRKDVRSASAKPESERIVSVSIKGLDVTCQYFPKELSSSKKSGELSL